MSRSFREEEPSRAAVFSASPALSAAPSGAATTPLGQPARNGLNTWIARFVLIAAIAALCHALGPFHLRGAAAAGFGALTAVVVFLMELRLRRASVSGLVGGALGGAAGTLAALAVTVVISLTATPEPTKSFLEFTALCVLGYLGLALGAERGSELRVESIARWLGGRSEPSTSLKLLDTSVLIDGRIADICEAQFLDGTLIVPQFVLRELQLVADSSDGLKRQRGRRGLDVLDHIKKMPGVEVRILDQDTSASGEVDHKLVELARRMGAKLVTNDFNLNKVATVQGLAVLNVNQLANALKPVVLPGESMCVFVLREGKEANQGVAYLDDGTMVVVDGARRFINKNVDIVVTSVHQSTAGKMIFGRTDERGETAGTMARHAAAGMGRRETAPRGIEPLPMEQSGRGTYPEADAD
jgi:uncharacterized protein YacL